MILILAVIGAILLLAGSSFFSASETALVSLSAHKSKRLAIKNPNLKGALLGWIGKPHELLILILMGNTLTTVMFAAVLTAIAVRVLYDFSPSTVEWVAWTAETIVIVVIGDMTPKFFARAYPEKTSLLVLPILSRLRKLSGPLFYLLSLTGFLFPRKKSPLVGKVLTFSMEELKSFLEEGTPPHPESKESMGMMQRVLEINQRKVESIMTPLEKVDYIEIDPQGKPARDRDLLLDLIVESGHTRTPVKLKGEFVGFIHSDDLLPLVLEDKNRELVTLVRKPMEFPYNRMVAQVLEDFRNSGIYAGFVRDENKNVIGLVTVEDVLEEITGEIMDEYDAKPESPS